MLENAQSLNRHDERRSMGHMSGEEFENYVIRLIDETNEELAATNGVMPALTEKEAVKIGGGVTGWCDNIVT